MMDASSPQKLCCTCRELKPLEVFSKSKKSKDGHQARCKACRAKAYADNVEFVREQRRAYTNTNRERIEKTNQAYYRDNAETILESHRAYRVANREKVKLLKRAYRAEHPDWSRTQDHNRRALIKGNGGSFTEQQIIDMRRAQNGVCAYCAWQYGVGELTIDHIIPIAQGGSNDISNICLACPRCNFSKNNRTPEQWVHRWYYTED